MARIFSKKVRKVTRKKKPVILIIAEPLHGRSNHC